MLVHRAGVQVIGGMGVQGTGYGGTGNKVWGV